MYEDDVPQPPGQAGSAHHHFRDVLQAFVQDFSLRQAAGETKIREIERQVSDATGEIHILRRLLEEYQTKLNDDNLLIARLHHEIEALQGRISNLDKKNIHTEALSSRLELRLEHLKESLTQTCNDTQKGVSKLLGNFARVQFSGDYDKHEGLRPTKEPEASVRRKYVSTFAQAKHSDGSGLDDTTEARKSTGYFALDEKADSIHSTHSRQISADKPHAFQSSTEYVTPTNDDSMTNERPSTDTTNDLNPTTCLPSGVATHTVSHQPAGQAKTVNFSNNVFTKHASSQDSSNFTAKIPSSTTRDNIQPPGRTRSYDNTPSDSAHPATKDPPSETLSSTGNRGQGLPKGKKAPKGSRGQGLAKNRKQPRTTNEEQGRSNRRHRTISLTEEQSNFQNIQRRTASFCEDQIHSIRKDRPNSVHKELNTTKKQRTSSFTGEQGKPNKNYCTSVTEELGNSSRTNLSGVNEHRKSENRKEQTKSQVTEEQVTIKSKEQPISTRNNNEQASSSSKNSTKQINNLSSNELNAQAPGEQITSKAEQEQANIQGNEEHITAQACKEQITSKAEQEQANIQGNEEHITAQACKEQITSKAEQEQANNQGTEEHITAQANKEQITSKVEGQANIQGNKKHITAQACKEQSTSKADQEQVNNQGTEKQINAQAPGEQITSKAEQVNTLCTEEHITFQASKEQITSKAEQVNIQCTEEHITFQASKEQNTSKAEQVNIQCTKEHITFHASEEQSTSKDDQEQANTQGNEEHIVQASKEQGTSKAEQEQENNQGTEEHITAQASKEQITPRSKHKRANKKGNDKQVNKGNEKQVNKGNEKQVNKGNEKQVNKGNEKQANKGNEKQVNKSNEKQANKGNDKQVNKGNEKQVNEKENETQVNKGNAKQVNAKDNEKQVNNGNEKHVNKGNDKQVNKGNDKQVNEKENEKQVNKGNEKQVNTKDNEKQVNKGNEKQVNKGNEKQVNKSNEKQVNEKENEKHENEKQVNKGIKKQVNEKSNEKQVKSNNKQVKSIEKQVNETVNENQVTVDIEKQVKKDNEKQVNKRGSEQLVSEEQASAPDTSDSLSPKNSENQVSSYNSEEHRVAQGSEKRAMPSCSEEHVISPKVSEQPMSLSSKEHEGCQSTEEQMAVQTTEKNIPETFSKGEEQLKDKQTFQCGKEDGEAFAKETASQNTEETAPKDNEEHRTPQGIEEQPNTHEPEEETSQNRRRQHSPASLEGKDRCLMFSQSESSPVDAGASEHLPDEGVLERPPQNQQEGSDVAATSDKTISAKQRKAKNKDKQVKWEESKREEVTKQESAWPSAAKDESVFLPGLRRRSFRMEGEEEHQEQEVGMCANCGFLAKLRCANCRQAFYCKRDCQREHWKKGHKDQCQPFQVMESAELGRYMVASRDLKAGDVIVKEDPLVVGPKQITEPVCLGCYRRVDGSYRCQKCQWPLCGAECEAAPDHLPECVVGQEIGSPIDITNYDEPNHFYEVIFPLRCLALKKKSPKKYEQLLSLESHYEDRKGTHVHKENQKSIINFLRNYFFIQEFPIEDIDSSERSIHNITGIIDVNALELRLKETEVLGLYPTFAMLEHSCTPNTKHTFNKDRQVVLKAAVDIKRGEHISTMYTHILWGTAARRDHLKHSKYFMCTCFRCSDPTELGTHFSALRCKSCTNGFMLSAAPLDELASWICTSCNATMTSEVVTQTNLKLGEDVEAALAMPNREALEELIQRHAKNTVHPNHFHLFATRHTLLQMYGRDPNSADEASMKKKEKMCQDFLKVCTALDPGMSRLAPYAGVALYEYHLAVLARVRQDPDAKQVDSAALKKDVETAKALLQQCIRVLQDEPADQPEGQLCHVAQQNLAELRQWEATLS